MSNCVVMPVEPWRWNVERNAQEPQRGACRYHRLLAAGQQSPSERSDIIVIDTWWNCASSSHYAQCIIQMSQWSTFVKWTKFAFFISTRHRISSSEPRHEISTARFVETAWEMLLRCSFQLSLYGGQMWWTLAVKRFGGNVMHKLNSYADLKNTKSNKLLNYFSDMMALLSEIRSRRRLRVLYSTPSCLHIILSKNWNLYRVWTQSNVSPDRIDEKRKGNLDAACP